MPPKGSKMGQTPVKREPSIEHSAEYHAFMQKLAEYHEKRGTTLENEPKVGTRHLDLHKLYERVVGEGGYDLVSDTKAKPLMWRKIAEEFLGKGPHLAAQAFLVKSAYYKNLVAYEITNHWHKEPPPKEILEDTTAKGGNVMGRTMENFQRPHTREEGNLANGNSSDAEDEGHAGQPGQTPKQERGDKMDKMDTDEVPGSATGRSSRGLRQAPPQRVLYNPDTVQSSTRQPRNASNNNPTSTPNHAPSPSPATAMTNSLHNPAYALANNTSMTLANYEPPQQYPLSLKPVTTPANNPEHYKLKRKIQQDASASLVAKKYKGLMLPGTGFIGPNIYVRAQLALQSGIPEEEEYALHHLVKISHERGDKYRFDQFAGLAEALVNKVLQVSSLFYDIDWVISYDNDSSAVPPDAPVLDAINGTPDVLKRLKSRLRLDTDDHVTSSHFTRELGRIIEAALVIRNMVMLEENAKYISRLPLLSDYFCIVLNLGPHPAIVELQNYALETAEQLTKYYDMSSQHVLYRSLLDQLDSTDRGSIITSLRAISRTGMNCPGNKRLEDVPLATVKKICTWIMVQDEELRLACLDFLFQYTSIAENVETLILDMDAQALVRQLSSLLLFNAKPQEAYRSKVAPAKEMEHVTHVPRLAPELVQQLLRFQEPERSSHWLRMCFQDDPDSEMTQIHLWQSYQGTFVPYATTHPHLIAGDFIKNVSTTFTGASAQVAGSNKYVIRGIKPRVTPVDYKGRELVRCQWKAYNGDIARDYGHIFSHSTGSECGGWFGNSTSVHTHILTHHLRIPKKSTTPADVADPTSRPSSSAAAAANGKILFDFVAVAAAHPDVPVKCDWSSCSHTKTPVSAVNYALLARHVDTHLPDTGVNSAWQKRHNRNTDTRTEEPVIHTWQKTMVDEKGDAAGVPVSCALVMRNIARAIPQLAAAAGSASGGSNGAAGAGANDDDDDHEHDHDDDQGANGYDDFAPGNGDDDDADDSGTRALMKQIFAPSKDKLFHAMAHNIVVSQYVAVVLKMVSAGGG